MKFSIAVPALAHLIGQQCRLVRWFLWSSFNPFQVGSMPLRRNFLLVDLFYEGMRDVTAYSLPVRGHRHVSCSKGGRARGEEQEEARNHAPY